MKILILSIGTGGRYDAAAKNISDYFSERGHIVRTVDYLTLAAPVGDALKQGHAFASRHMPHLYGIGRSISEMSAPAPAKPVVGAFKALLESEGFDAVICVHISGALLVSAYRTQYASSLPSFFFTTDFYCPAGCAELNIDLVLLPHALLHDEFASAGVAESRLCVTGMPLSADILDSIPEHEARQALGLPEHGRVILLCSGTLGVGPIRRTVMRLAGALGPDDRLIVLCGTNLRLKRELELFNYNDTRISFEGMTDRMSVLLDAADILVTKGGSMISAEAAYKDLPIVYIDAIPGADAENVRFMTHRGFAASGETAEVVARLTSSCLSGSLDPASMLALRCESFKDGSAAIYKAVTDFCEAMPVERRERKLLFVMNPVAGKLAVPKRLSDILEVFSRNGCISTVFPTEGAGDAERFASELAGDFDLVVCSGGDGTMSETAAGLIAGGHHVPVGYIPCGSTNDFAEYHVIPSDVCAAAQLAVTGGTSPVDIGRLSGRCFINAAEFGLFTRAAYSTPQKRKNFLGFYAYVLEGMKELGEIKSSHMTFTVDGESIEGDFIFGIVAAASSLTDSALEFFGQPVISGDGLFELVLIRQPSSPLELEGILRSLRMKDPNSSLVSFRRGRHISVTQEGELNWVVDGNLLVTKDSYDIEILPSRIDLIC